MARRRKLNIPLIKGIVMLFVGLFTSFASALSGIGSQIAAAPAIGFLLGFSPEKSAGTAIAVALAASAAAAAAAVAGGVPFSAATVMLVVLGATIGTMAAAKAATAPRLANLRRAAGAAAVFVGVLVLNEGIRHRFGGPAQVPLPVLGDIPGLSAFAVGVLTGLLSAVCGISTGVLLVPALIYVLGLRAPEAIVVSLAVVALASLLPAFGYSARGLVDRTMGRWMEAGAVVGGLFGGWLLSQLPTGHAAPYVAFGLAAMFLSAWQAWRNS